MHRHVGNRGRLRATYRIDEQLLKALDRKVWLPSGGTLVIDRTEAMTVIDVNTGKFTGSGGNLEETVTRNNLEAAEEIVRQLRLRDIGGIIVIDFIDMVLEANRDLVLRRLTECLARDRTRHQVAEVTSLGLVQMTRKRVGGGLLEHFSTPCEHCRGRGVIVDTEAIEHVEPAKPERDGGSRKARGGRGRRGDGRDERPQRQRAVGQRLRTAVPTGPVGDHAAVVAATAVIAAAGSPDAAPTRHPSRRVDRGRRPRRAQRSTPDAAPRRGGRSGRGGRAVVEARALRPRLLRSGRWNVCGRGAGLQRPLLDASAAGVDVAAGAAPLARRRRAPLLPRRPRPRRCRRACCCRAGRVHRAAAPRLRRRAGCRRACCRRTPCRRCRASRRAAPSPRPGHPHRGRTDRHRGRCACRGRRHGAAGVAAADDVVARRFREPEPRRRTRGPRRSRAARPPGPAGPPGGLSAGRRRPAGRCRAEPDRGRPGLTLRETLPYPGRSEAAHVVTSAAAGRARPRATTFELWSSASMYAIVKTGGKQYKVAVGDIVAVEKIDGPVGTEIALPALLLVDGDDVVTDARRAGEGVGHR